MKLVRGGVAVVKFVGIFGGAAEVAALPPEVRPTLIIGRIEESEFGIAERMGNDAAAYARSYFARYLAKPIHDHPELNAWEGPNEPTANNGEGMAWYANFLYELARLIRAEGKTAVIGNWSVGSPDYPLWQFYARALQAVRDHGAVLGRHSYSGPDKTTWPFLLLRHRADNAIFETMGYGDSPVVLTETGADSAPFGVPPGEAWRDLFGPGGAMRYADEILVPLEMELRKDDYVIGAALFTFGPTDWWPRHNVDGTGIVEKLLSISMPQEADTMDRNDIMVALQAHLDSVRDHVSRIVEHVVQVGLLATQLAVPPVTPPSPPPPPPIVLYTPKVKNQVVFDALGTVGKSLGLNMIALMPYDLTIWMIAHRQDVYTGQPVQQWGLDDKQKGLLIEEIKKRTV